jgi:radical SAM-linked protein
MSRRPQPEHRQAPVVQRIRIRYAKRGRMRFTSHRDFARAFERAVVRAGVPVAYSSGFSPHPRISYASAAPTTTASEAEYLEIGLREPVDPQALARALDAALPPGLDVIEAVLAHGGSLAERIDAARWRIELTGVDPANVRRAVAAFLAADEVLVDKLTKNGRRNIDARGPVVTLAVVPSIAEGETAGTTGIPDEVTVARCAILDLVVRQVTPTVRPDDVLSGLRVVADLESPVAPRATRLAQGALTAQGEIVDPLRADREVAGIGTPLP